MKGSPWKPNPSKPGHRISTRIKCEEQDEDTEEEYEEVKGREDGDSIGEGFEVQIESDEAANEKRFEVFKEKAKE